MPITPPLAPRVLGSVLLAAACASCLHAQRVAANVVADGFENAASPLVRAGLASNGAGDTRLRLEAGRVVLEATRGWETVALAAEADIFVTFALSVEVFPLQVDYSGGYVGLFVMGTYAPDANNGLMVRLRNEGFSDSTYVLELLREGEVVAASAPLDISEVPGRYTAFRLGLRGELDGAEARVTGTLEPLDGLNPAAVRREEVRARFPWSAAAHERRLYGIRQNIPGNNPVRVACDNLELVH